MSQHPPRDEFSKACALQAMYLWQGFIQAGPLPLMDNSDRFGGQIEAAEWLADFSPVIASAFHATHQAVDSFPGVYCYEVTEELGAWLRKNQSTDIEQFGVALKMKTESLLGEPCNFLDVVIQQFTPSQLPQPSEQSLLALATTALLDISNGYAHKELASVNGLGLENLISLRGKPGPSGRGRIAPAGEARR